jgi:ABC-type glycerol-3-phosphate transport system permease component
VDSLLVEAAWTSVYRGLALRGVSVRDTRRRLHPAEESEGADGTWTTVSGSARLGRQPGEGRRPPLTIVYDLRHGARASIQATLPLPVPADELLSVTVPLRPDRSWHRMRPVLELEGRRYVAADPLYLGQRRWQELSLKLAALDPRDERELGVWPLVLDANQAGAFAQPGRFRVTLTIERASPLAALWRKYTSNYRSAYIAAEHRWRYVLNSAYLAALTIVGQLLSCSLVAYGFARLRWPGREALFGVLLATMMLPHQVTMIPVFLIYKALGWYNTLKTLWVPSFLGSAFFIFMLRQFMKGIPTDLEDAAKIDGCSLLGIYWRIVLPLVKPALAAVAIFTFMGTWNDFMGPLIYVNDQRLYPLALGLFDFRTLHGGDFGLLMAASTLMTLPVVAVFFLAQKYFIQGVTLTGMKG